LDRLAGFNLDDDLEPAAAVLHSSTRSGQIADARRDRHVLLDAGSCCPLLPAELAVQQANDAVVPSCSRTG
jgi:hypothetical protein